MLQSLPIPVAESPIPQEIILESLAYNRLNRLSEKTREEGVHHSGSHRGNFHHCSVPQQQPEKHSREGHAPPPASAHAQFDSSFRGNEKPRLGKRKHGDTEGSKSEVEKKCRQIDDKYQEKDSKLQDLDGFVFRIDNDNGERKAKKKKHIRKLKDFSEYLGCRLEKTTQEKKTVPIFSGNSLREQYRNQGSEEPYKDRKPSGGCDNKNYGFIPSSEYMKVVQVQEKPGCLPSRMALPSKRTAYHGTWLCHQN
ncbi:uncharacterized protein [Melopsittacus undulatus]|uniref:uncharacterized protein n=1 Tax=Melopsittacus undulatus TaxID=13146 RepID=UPI00146B6B06|nr:uncharacterized protein LOC117436578 [Melopsittacus undulatus]